MIRIVKGFDEDIHGMRVGLNIIEDEHKHRLVAAVKYSHFIQRVAGGVRNIMIYCWAGGKKKLKTFGVCMLERLKSRTWLSRSSLRKMMKKKKG
ncbi:hypothetical protein HanRHA438_Chr01g0014641 [Helianthus annuus]|nr:hypothetical protein HanXRQr2_Chr01g0014201 [Helianthus annuus]KAJ0622073.1 hypothetical protein HanIR_Chr01g0015981 [Helianthus annuus]KAJ0626399.1 hypothetical protein HanHA89_Chr01g0012741 [Helianthus annuus]KAJ0759611.1 hypothetical protein HanOQP8_Chr04g0128631 [Helianthus annuus]KAJ0782742.1 hypothetical protein HanLR1_Chr01g0011741 [Helianthus annuus]